MNIYILPLNDNRYILYSKIIDIDDNIEYPYKYPIPDIFDKEKILQLNDNLDKSFFTSYLHYDELKEIITYISSDNEYPNFYICCYAYTTYSVSCDVM